MKTDLQLAAILDRCIDEMRGGGDAEQLLAQYPEAADQIRPLLLLVDEIESQPDPVPAVEDLMHTIVRLSGQPSRGRASGRFGRSRVPMRTRLLKTAAIVLVMFTAGWGTVTTSAEAVPGDLLYPIKLFTERARFFLTINEERKAELRIVFSAERLKEAVLRHKRGEGLDRELLTDMLQEARWAVEAGAELPDPTRDLIMARTAKLSEFQKETLGQLKSRVAPEEQPVVVQYMDMCGRRAVWMWQGLERGEREELDEREEQDEQEVTPTTRPAAPQGRVKRWMESCPPMNCCR